VNFLHAGGDVGSDQSATVDERMLLVLPISIVLEIVGTISSRIKIG